MAFERQSGQYPGNHYGYYGEHVCMLVASGLTSFLFESYAGTGRVARYSVFLCRRYGFCFGYVFCVAAVFCVFIFVFVLVLAGVAAFFSVLFCLKAESLGYQAA